MAASVIGALRVNLGLDSAQFSKGLSQSSGRLSRFAAQAGKIAAGLAASFGTAMTAMGMGAINAASEIERLSQVANTAPKQFQGWAAGAASVGIEQEKLADILKDVNDRVGDFVATGGGPMADFFTNIAPKVGVTAEQFRNLSGADALQLYVSSLEKANANQQDFTFYMEAMASDSTLLLPLLKNGGKAMQEYADKAARMGAIMDNQMIASLREGKGAVAEMRLAVDGMKNTIGAQAVPVIKALAAAVSSAATFFHQHAETISSVLRTLAGTAVAAAAVFATQYAVAVGVTAVRAIMAASAAAATYQIQLGATTTASVLLGSATRSLAIAFTALKGAIISTGIGAVVVAAGYLIGKFIELVEKTGGVGNAFRALGDIASAVWTFMVTSASAIPDGLQAVWNRVQAGFMQMVQNIRLEWGKLLNGLAINLNSRNLAKLGFGQDIIQGLRDTGDEVIKNAYSTQGAIDGLLRAAESAGGKAMATLSGAAAQLAVDTRLASMGLKDLSVPIPALKAETDSVTASIGGGLAPALDKAGGAAKSAAEKLTPLQGVLKKLREESEKLKATLWMSDTEATVWENLREAKVAATSQSGKEIAALTRTNEGLKQLKESTDSWRDSLKSTFGDLVSGASSFKDALRSVLQQLAKMWADSAFMSLWSGSGMGKWFSGLLPKIGANANGTSNWRGGLTRINERGGEIVDLPSGTRIIPHDVSKRMADDAAAGDGSGHMSIGFDKSTGDLTATMYDIAGNVVARSRQSIIGSSVRAVGAMNRKSKSFLG